MNILRERYLAFTLEDVVDYNGDPIASPFDVVVGRTDQINGTADTFDSAMQLDVNSYCWLLDLKPAPEVSWVNSVYCLRVYEGVNIVDLKPIGFPNLVVDRGESEARAYYKYEYQISPPDVSRIIWYDENDDPVLQATLYKNCGFDDLADSIQSITNFGRIEPYTA